MCKLSISTFITANISLLKTLCQVCLVTAWNNSIGECKTPYQWKKAGISVKEGEDSPVYSNEEKHQWGKELYTERQRGWGRAGCKYSKGGARNTRAQEASSPAL